jgi:hypothetical protein
MVGMNGLGRYLFMFGLFTLATAAGYLNTQSVAVAGPLTTGLMLILYLFVGLLFIDLIIRIFTAATKLH